MLILNNEPYPLPHSKKRRADFLLNDFSNRFLSIFLWDKSYGHIEWNFVFLRMVRGDANHEQQEWALTFFELIC